MICVTEEARFTEFTRFGTGGPVARALVIPEAASTASFDVAAAINEIRPEGQEIVILAATHSVASQIAQLAAVLTQGEQQTERLIEGMFIPGSTASPATALQAQRNAEARQELIDEFGLYDSDQVAEVAGSSANNRSATASRWSAAKKIFTVNHDGARMYPGFQFGTDGQPRPVIANVLEAFHPYGLDGWETALWFTTASGWLDDERPVDLLTREPEQIVEAAHHLFDEAVQ
jgi:hypothetical protein